MGARVSALIAAIPEHAITLRLSRNDTSQVIDGLTVCDENWRKTFNRADSKLDVPDFLIFECDGRAEAG